MSQGVASSGLSELIVAIGRSQDPQGLSEKLVPHLDTLLKIVQPTEKLTGVYIVDYWKSCSNLSLILFPVPDPTSPDGLSIVPDLSSTSTSWEPFSQGIKELLLSLQAFTDFSQVQLVNILVCTCKCACSVSLPQDQHVWYVYSIIIYSMYQ